MKKVRFLLAVLVLLGIGILIFCRYYSRSSITTLKVVIHGPYALVRTKSRPNVITVFSPRDPDHVFYANNLEKGMTQNVHIALSPEGLKPAAALSIDPYFPKEFIAETDLWQRPDAGDPDKDYFVTIELPVPDNITFTSLNRVTFENGAQAFMATDFVLEYQVTNSSKVRTDSPELKSIRPLASSDLQKQYASLCESNGVSQKYYYNSCVDMRKLLEQCEGGQTSVLFFGVGIPRDANLTEEQMNLHAVKFFNNAILQSFPHLKGKKLFLKEESPPERDGPTAMLMEVSFRPATPHKRMLLVSAVIDCKAGVIIVKTTQ